MDNMLDELEIDIKELAKDYGEEYGFKVGSVDTESHRGTIYVTIKIEEEK